MGPVDRLVQRRQIRRATERALLTPTPLLAQTGVIDEDERVDVEGLDEALDDDEPITAPIFVGEIHQPDESSWDGRTPAVGRGHRATQATIAVIAAAAIAIVVSVVLILLRSPGVAPRDSKTAVTSSAPAPTTARPTPSRLPATQPVVSPPPAPPPPPPPPPAQQAPVLTGSNPAPRSEPPSPAERPQIGVTRTPISVAPSVKATPTNTATPGDAPRRSWGFF